MLDFHIIIPCLTKPLTFALVISVITIGKGPPRSGAFRNVNDRRTLATAEFSMSVALLDTDVYGVTR